MNSQSIVLVCVSLLFGLTGCGGGSSTSTVPEATQDAGQAGSDGGTADNSGGTDGTDDTTGTDTGAGTDTTAGTDNGDGTDGTTGTDTGTDTGDGTDTTTGTDNGDGTDGTSGTDTGSDTGDGTDGTTDTDTGTDGETNGTPVAFELSSTVMADGGSLPVTFTCDGNSDSPPLAWQGAPAGTAEFALVMEHHSGPDEVQWYWLLHGIPETTDSLASNEAIGTPGVNGVNGLSAYAPPCSKGPGLKWYTLTLYALSGTPQFDEPATVDRAGLLTAITDLTLASTSLKVSYERQVAVEQTPCEAIQNSVSAAGFTDVAVTCDSEYAYVTSDTYPDHVLMNGITGTNEQIPVPAVNYAAPIKLAPAMATSPTTIDAAVGVAVNGVPIYDYSAQGELDIYNYDPASDTLVLGQLDQCGGHAGRGDDYHYHAAPNCMIEAMPNRGDDAIIGWGYDGYPLYGNNNPDGSPIASGTLDVCNGQADDAFGYRYHTSEAAPYIIQCLVGEVDTRILPRVSPLSGDRAGIRANLHPPQGGVDNLNHSVDANGRRTMTYEYRGQSYYVTYAPSAQGNNCYDFEQKTVSNGGVVETGTFCR